MSKLPSSTLACLLAFAVSAVLCPALLADAPDAAAPGEATAPAEQPVSEPAKAPAAKFIRVERDAQQTPISLETAVVRYVPAAGDEGVTVDLIGAVHVGDKSYYEALNKQFEQYDVLLYELVAPPGQQVPRTDEGGEFNPLRMMQQMMKSMLDLESQVEHIDYTKANFVHADLSPAQMAEAIRKRGDDGLTLFLGVAADLLRQANLQELELQEEPTTPAAEDEVPDLFSALFDPQGPLTMKRTMAEQFEALEAGGDAGLGNTLTTILIADRNEAAMKVFQTELAKGKKRIGIFYGAAHMPDFEQRLQNGFGLKRDSEHWIQAWDLREGRGKSPLQRFLEEQ